MTTQQSRSINGKACTLAEFTAAATNPQRCVVVQACAGAGKTELLVQRMLEILKAGVPPQGILAITFTKKAAGEMRHRLMQRLQLPENAALYEQVLDTGRPVEIRTFHSWFAALLRMCPHSVLEELELPPSFEIAQESHALIQRTWRNFHAAVLASPALLSAYEARVADVGRYELRKQLDQVLAQRAEFKLANAAGAVGKSQPDWRLSHPAFVAADGEDADPAESLWARAPLLAVLQDARTALLAHGGKTTGTAALGLATAMRDCAAPAAMAALLTLKFEPRKLLDHADVAAAQQLLKDIRAAQAARLQFLHQQHLHALASALVAAHAIAQRQLQVLDLQTVELAALRLLRDEALCGWMAQRLDARWQQLLVDEFQDTNPLQWQALSQWLASYAGAGGGANSAMRVFVVGDPKQSIYGFRGAQAGVFDAAKAFLRQGFAADLLQTNHSFRCGPPVLAALNSVFVPLAQKAEDDALAYPGFEAHTGEDATLGAVQCLPRIDEPTRREEVAAPQRQGSGLRSAFEPSQGAGDAAPGEIRREREVSQAAAWLADRVAQGENPADFLVLARKNAAFTGFAAALRGHGIAFVQHAERALASTPEVQDLLALCDVLASPGHNLSLARVLKSPIFAWDDAQLADLARLADGASWLEALFELLQKDEQETEQTRRQIGNISLKTAVCLQIYSRWAASLPPHDFLTQVYAHPGLGEVGENLPIRYAKAVPLVLRESVLANLQSLLGAALDVQSGRFLSLYGFVRAVKLAGIRAAPVRQAQAVQGMTIHGAKGLQARHVLLLDADPQAKADNVAGMQLLWPADAASPRDLFFLRSNQVPDFAQNLLERKVQQFQREDLNALYVAMTRAKTSLTFSACMPHRASVLRPWELLRDAVGVAAVDAGATPKPIANAADTALAPFELQELPFFKQYSQGVCVSIEFDAIKFDSSSQGQRRNKSIGQAVHLLLQWAPLRPGGGAQWHWHEALAACKRCQLGADCANDVLTLATKIANAANAAWAWNSDVIDHAANEVDLGQAGRADRVVRARDGQWWVLDYKTAANAQHLPQVAAQLSAYQQALEHAVGASVNTAVLTPN